MASPPGEDLATDTGGKGTSSEPPLQVSAEQVASDQVQGKDDGGAGSSGAIARSQPLQEVDPAELPPGFVTTSVDLADSKSTGEFDGQVWLEEHLKQRKPLGLAAMWRHDRREEDDNPVSLIALAGADRALLLRTHRIGHYLPKALSDVLSSATLRKPLLDAGKVQKKLGDSFGSVLGGIVDLGDLAELKGAKHHDDPEALAEELGWHSHVEARSSRADWGAPTLTQEQVAQAVDKSRLAFYLLEELDKRDHVQLTPDASDPMQKSCLAMQPGWHEQGVRKGSNGLFCTLCGSGPILDNKVMERHIAGQGHQRRLNPPGSPDPSLKPIEVPESIVARGIVASDGQHPRCPVGTCYCKLCDAGPFQTVANAEVHLSGRLHLKREKQRDGGNTELPEVLPADLEEAGVRLLEGALVCSICQAGPFSNLQGAQQHIRGRMHIKKTGGIVEIPSHTLVPALPSTTIAAGPTMPAPVVPAAEPSTPLEMPPGVDEKALEGLPSYVAVGSKQFCCELCDVVVTELAKMQRHLDSEQHASACKLWNKPPLIFVEEEGRLETLDGRPVRRSKEQPRKEMEADAAAASSGEMLSPGSPLRGGLARSRSSSTSRHVRFSEDEDEQSMLPLGTKARDPLQERDPWAASPTAASPTASLPLSAEPSATQSAQPLVTATAGGRRDEEDPWATPPRSPEPQRISPRALAPPPLSPPTSPLLVPASSQPSALPPRFSDDILYAPSGTFRPGDWECPHCGAHNFAHREFCFRCDKPRVAGASRKGDGKGSSSLRMFGGYPSSRPGAFGGVARRSVEKYSSPTPPEDDSDDDPWSWDPHLAAYGVPWAPAGEKATSSLRPPAPERPVPAAAQPAAVEPKTRLTEATARKLKGTVVRVAETVASPPPGQDPSTYMLADVSEAVQLVEVCEDDWVWVQRIADKNSAGYIRCSMLCAPNTDEAGVAGVQTGASAGGSQSTGLQRYNGQKCLAVCKVEGPPAGFEAQNYLRFDKGQEISVRLVEEHDGQLWFWGTCGISEPGWGPLSSIAEPLPPQLA